MAQFNIPTDARAPFWRQTTALDGTAYVLSFAYNQRERVYTLSLATTGGVALASGIKLLTNVGLLGTRTDPRLPPGELVAYTSTQDTSPADIGELGKGLRCELVYFDASEARRLVTQ